MNLDGQVTGVEPAYTGTTTRGLNHLATPAIFILRSAISKNRFAFIDQLILTFRFVASDKPSLVAKLKYNIQDSKNKFNYSL